FCLFPITPSRDLPHFSTPHQPPQAELISGKGAKRIATPPPSFPEPSPPLHRRSSRNRARNRRFSLKLLSSRSPSILHQIVRAPEVRSIHRRDLQKVRLARTTSRRSTKESTLGHPPSFRTTTKCRTSLFWVWTKYRGDSAEFSAEV
ncbi:hypothetical protein Prudu_005530, partial [Prunus dulcis]